MLTIAAILALPLMTLAMVHFSMHGRREEESIRNIINEDSRILYPTAL